VIATSSSLWVVGGDQNWAATSIGASSFDWNWTGFWVAHANLLINGSATSTWSFNVNLRSGGHLESSWASGWLIVNWAFRRVTSTSVLWATFGFRSSQNRADTITDWSWWAEFWFVNANMIVSSAALMVVAVDVNGDWKFFDEASEFNGTVFDDWSSAMFWVTDTLELWATVLFSGTFFAVSTGRSDNDSDFFTSETVGFLVRFSSFGTSGGVALARFTAATRVSRFVKSLVFMANWVSVMEWARFDSTFTSPYWATVITVISVVSENFDFTKFAFFTDWTFWTVFRNVFSAFDWFAPFFTATSGSIRTNSFDFKLVARNGFVSALDKFFDDHTWSIASASSFDTFVFLSTVVFVPEFTGGVFDTALISADVAIGWIDTFVSLKN
jgi:hypothetical protein